ncbi:DUF485 domain-containing protein [Pseudonocardia sp. DSM 110487]|nr:DUF485 domain-containing protein [Pseudonocardia sp. DSM 110487]
MVRPVVPRKARRRCSARTEENGDDAVSATGERSTGTIYEQMQATPEFVELRRKLRRFVFPMSVAFLLWYLLYVLLASFAPAFMAIPVFGNINIGLIIGLLQFVTTFVITTVYVRYANRHLDPAAEKIRHEIEGVE